MEEFQIDRVQMHTGRPKYQGAVKLSQPLDNIKIMMVPKAGVEKSPIKSICY